MPKLIDNISLFRLMVNCPKMNVSLYFIKYTVTLTCYKTLHMKEVIDVLHTNKIECYEVQIHCSTRDNTACMLILTFFSNEKLAKIKHLLCYGKLPVTSIKKTTTILVNLTSKSTVKTLVIGDVEMSIVPSQVVALTTSIYNTTSIMIVDSPVTPMPNLSKSLFTNDNTGTT